MSLRQEFRAERSEWRRAAGERGATHGARGMLHGGRRHRRSASPKGGALGRSLRGECRQSATVGRGGEGGAVGESGRGVWERVGGRSAARPKTVAAAYSGEGAGEGQRLLRGEGG